MYPVICYSCIPAFIKVLYNLQYALNEVYFPDLKNSNFWCKWTPPLSQAASLPRAEMKTSLKPDAVLTTGTRALFACLHITLVECFHILATSKVLTDTQCNEIPAYLLGMLGCI